MKKRDILFTLLFSILMISCQSTPAKEVVVNKNDGELERLIAETTGDSSYAYDEHWKTQQQNKLINVNIDADVEVPDGGLAVVRVEDKPFTQEEADSIFEYLSEGKSLNKFQYQKNKKELEQDILDLKYTISKLKKEGTTYAADTLEQYNSELANLELQYKNALDELPDEPANLKFSELPEDEEYLQAVVDLGGTYRRVINIGNRTTDKYIRPELIVSTTQFITKSRSENLFSMMYEDKIAEPVALKISEEEARSLSDEIKNGIGADLELVEFYATDLTERMDMDGTHEYWVAEYTRTVNNIPTIICSGDTIILDSDPEQASNIFGWAFERLTICIDDDGIANLYWRGRTEEIGIENKNVSLVDFEEIKEKILHRLSIVDYIEENTGVLELKVCTEDIKLQYLRMAVKNQPTEGRLVPVWAVYGSMQYVYDRDKMIELNAGYGEFREMNIQSIDKAIETFKTPLEYDYPLVIINAVDGSIIDQQLGY